MSIGIHCVFIFSLASLVNSRVEECGRFYYESDSFNHSDSLVISRDNILRYYDNLQRDRLESSIARYKRSDATFVGHPKTREERWHTSFNRNSIKLKIEQTQSLVSLLNKVIDRYLNACIPIVFYDSIVENTDGIVLQMFFQSLKITYLHGRITDNYTVVNENLLNPYDKTCRSYILFLANVERARDVLGPQISNRVVLVAWSTQWKLQEFLSSKESSDIINLLVVGESLTADVSKERPYVLYTHRLYSDGLGSNSPVVLTSWIKGKLSRPNVNLYPPKFQKGFAGHRFLVSAIHQPPFVIKRLSTDGVGNTQIDWTGFEVKILNMLSQQLNFTFEIIEPKLGNELGPTYGVIDMVAMKKSDIGLAGAYVSSERILRVDMSHPHTIDCAAFITLASKALPRYRAIMGPFQWPVWLAIIGTYVFSIFPLTFSDRLTLRHLIGNYGEIENMFWYMFGTFTNSLTFKGEYSWVQSKKSSTRILIGIYWIFSIIITACYTSSIIAFVTLPVFPSTIDSIDGLLSGFYRVGTLSTDGWQYWFSNSSHPATKKLMKNLEFVHDIEEGLRNVTSAFFWGYAFVGSRTQLEYIVQTNFSDKAMGKRSALHIGDECITIFGISFVFPHNSVYARTMNDAIMNMGSAGLIEKIKNEIAWELQRSDISQLLEATKTKKFSFADVEERKLSLADTEGMFLLMGIGYLTAGAVLVSEIVGGCAIRCRNFARRNSQTITSITTNMMSNKHSDPSDEEHMSRSDQWRKLIWKFRRDSNMDEENQNKTKFNRKKHKRSESISQNAERFFGSFIDKQGYLETGESFGRHEPNPSEENEPSSSSISDEPDFTSRLPTPYTKTVSDEALEEFP